MAASGCGRTELDVNLSEDGLSADARVWLRDDTMLPGENGQTISHSPEVIISFPGVNGLRFAEKESCLYFTSSAQDVFCRVAVDPRTREAVGKPEVIQLDEKPSRDLPAPRNLVLRSEHAMIRCELGHFCG